MVKVVSIVGARPQFIKSAVVSSRLRLGGVDECLLHTGQHSDHDMSAQFFDELGIPKPQINLEIGGLPQGAMTGRMLEAIERVLVAERPDWVLVYGDTNSTLAGALAASKLHIRVAHAEAGLRSFNRRMPEEINRILVDSCSDLLLVPSETGAANLLREGHPEEKICRTADLMVEAVRHFQHRALVESGILRERGLQANGFVLATLHRAENVDDPRRLHHLLRGLRVLAQQLPVVLPLHPRTRAALLGESTGLLELEPVGYLDMISLVSSARLVATDSGGLQKEAFALRTPCLALRAETEWVELVERGFVRLCDGDSSFIADGLAWADGEDRDWECGLYEGPTTADVLLRRFEACVS